MTMDNAYILVFQIIWIQCLLGISYIIQISLIKDFIGFGDEIVVILP